MEYKTEFGSNDTTPEAEHGNNDASADGNNINAGGIRKSTTHGILNALSAASGQQFDSVEAAIAYVARTSSQKQNSDGNDTAVDEVVQTSTRMGRGRTAQDTDLRDQFAKLQKDLAMKERALRQKELDTEILRHMGDKFDPDLADYAMSKVKSNIQFKRDGSYTIVNAKGQERYGMDGNPLTIAQLIGEIAVGNPKLLKQATTGGSGLRPGQGNFAGAPTDSIPSYDRDPAAFNQWAAKMGLGRGQGLKGLGVSATTSTSTKKIV